MARRAVGSPWPEKGSGATGLPPLFGSWAAVPSGATATAVDQTKLRLWSKTAFDQTRLTGDSWNDWFAGAYPHYPCVDAPPLRCYDFQGYETFPIKGPAEELLNTFVHRDNPGIGFRSELGFTVETLAPPIDGKTHVLRPYYMPTPHGSYFYLTLYDLIPPTGILRILFDTTAEKTVTAYLLDSAGAPSTRQVVTNDEAAQVELFVDETILGVVVIVEGRFGIVEICIGAGARVGNVERLQALAANLKSATSVWSAQGNVLEPYTDYRLVISTEASVLGAAVGPQSQTSYAYFKTGGPPALGGFTVPSGQTQESIDAGPNRLDAYVSQTVPPTIGQGDAAPAMPRPVFRAYDIGVVFNADYVDLLYKTSYRDLMLQILDSNGAPARDEIGRALSFENPWGVTSDLTLDAASASWIAAVDPKCMPINTTTIRHNQTLTTNHTPLLLDPTTRYNARLVPLLLHDDFTAPRYVNLTAATGAGARIGGWRVAELDSVSQASTWTVYNGGGGRVEQSVALTGSATSSTDCPPGSALIWDPVSSGAPAWKSIRLSAFVGERFRRHGRLAVSLPECL